MVDLRIDGHPGLALRWRVARFPSPLGELPSPPWLVELLRSGAAAPLVRPEGLRAAVRDLLRGHGYRPTGRGKPSSEYLAGAAEAGRLGSINAAVDVGNAVSLHSGLPISIVDLDACEEPLRIALPAQGESYVFNRAGQEIDVGGLLSLFDRDGPCANAVKDAQRTKTGDSTSRVIAIVWGADAFVEHVDAATAWLAELFARLGAVA